LLARPPSYGVSFVGSELFLRIPVIVRNSGARQGVISGCRFKPPASWGSVEDYAYAHSVWESIDPRNGAQPGLLGYSETFVSPIPVAGGEARVAIWQFNVAGADLPIGTHDIALQHPVGRKWRDLGRIDLVVTEHERNGFGSPGAHFNGLRPSVSAST
jgi:hypothetical protein